MGRGRGVRAAARARSAFPDVDVSGLVLSGPPVRVLAAQSRGAQLLVLGNARIPSSWPFRRTVGSSLGERVVRHARCPVAVIPPLRGDSPGASPRVVVGVGVSGSADALGLAFRAAAQRGIPVLAVHAWLPDLPADHEAVCGPVARSEAAARRMLTAALGPWTARFADVPVRSRLTAGDPTAALVEESDGAALLVIGSRGRAAVGARLLGSARRRLSRAARCPLVVVPAVTAGGRGALARRTATPAAGDDEMDEGSAPWR